MRKKNVLIIWLLLMLVTFPVMGAVPKGEDADDSKIKGAKQLTPILDVVGKELKRVGLKLLDNAIYSMEQLWQDTTKWKI